MAQKNPLCFYASFPCTKFDLPNKAQEKSAGSDKMEGKHTVRNKFEDRCNSAASSIPFRSCATRKAKHSLTITSPGTVTTFQTPYCFEKIRRQAWGVGLSF